MMQKLIIFGSVFSTVPAIVIASTKWRILDRKCTYLYALLITSLTCDVVLLVSAGYNFNNIVLIHLYTLIEISLLSLFFSKLLHHNWPVHLFFGVLLIILIVDITSLSGIDSFNTLVSSVESFGFITLSILFLIQEFRAETDIFIDQNPHFIFTIGILFYFSGSLFSFLMSSDILAGDRSSFYHSWIFHNIANILKNTLFAIGLWKVRQVA